MSTPTLDATIRDVTGKKVKALRATGWLPATIYGKGIEPLTVQFDDKLFNKTYRSTGRSALIELHIPGHSKQSAFVQSVQRHPVTRNILHVEFRVVDLKVATDVEVPITLIGESPIVKRNDGIINHVMHNINVHALPTDLPQHIEVDVSVLDALDKVIYVRDLPTSSLFNYTSDPDEVVVTITPSRLAVEAPAEEAVEAQEGVEPELVKRERAEVEGEEDEES